MEKKKALSKNSAARKHLHCIIDSAFLSAKFGTKVLSRGAMPKAVYLAFIPWAIVFLSAPSAALAGREEMARKEGYLEILSRIYKESQRARPLSRPGFHQMGFLHG